MKLKSILPQDTRVAEIYGAIGLVWLGVVCAFTSINYLVVAGGQTQPFWSVVFVLLGLLQLSAVALYPAAEVLRVIMSWVNGSAWVWVSLIEGNSIQPSEAGAFVLGIAQLYAFVINANLLRRSWT